MRQCERCGSDLKPNGLCRDETCPFSDHVQGCRVGWVGHPSFTEETPPCTCADHRGATTVTRQSQLTRIALTYLKANLDDAIEAFSDEDGRVSFDGAVIGAPTEDELASILGE